MIIGVATYVGSFAMFTADPDGCYVVAALYAI